MLKYRNLLGLAFCAAITLSLTSPAFAKPKASKATIDPSLPIVSAASQICSAGAGLRSQVLNLAKNGRAQAQAIGLQLLTVGSSILDTVESIADIPSSMPAAVDAFNQCIDKSPQLGALKRMPDDLDKIARDAKKDIKGAWDSGKGMGGKIRSAANQCGALIEARAKGAPGQFTSCLLGPRGMNIDQTEKDANALGSAFTDLGPKVGAQMGTAFSSMGNGFFQCAKDGGSALDKMFEGFSDGIDLAFANFGTCSGSVLMKLNPMTKIEGAMSDLEDLAGDAAMTPAALKDAINSCINKAADTVWQAVDPRAKLKNLGEQLKLLGQVLMSALDNSFGAIEQLFPNVAHLSDIEKRFKNACNSLKTKTGN